MGEGVPNRKHLGTAGSGQSNLRESEVHLKTLKVARNFFVGSLALTVFIAGLCLAVSPMRALGQSSPHETQSESNNQHADDSDLQIPSAIAKELDAMKKRIAQLEAELRQ